MLVMVDTEASNLESVLGSLRRVGVTPAITQSAEDIQKASLIILPGVGAFAQGMNSLRSKGLVDVLRHRILTNRIPVIGICLGMQMLADTSEEHGRHEGLGIIKGDVLRLHATAPGFRVPNVGWCDTQPTRAGRLFPDPSDMQSYYYIHSYHLKCADPSDAAATIDFGGQSIVVAVERGNIFGVQFHPEKSQDSGLDLLDGFFSKAHALQSA